MRRRIKCRSCSACNFNAIVSIHCCRHAQPDWASHAWGATLFLMSCASTQRQNNCNSYKEGKFKLNSRFDNSCTKIERHNSTQTETNSKTGEVVTAMINWTSSCEYELQYQAQTKNSADTINSFLQTRPLKTKIIKATKDYCIFEAHVDSINLKYVDTLWRLKN